MLTLGVNTASQVGRVGLWDDQEEKIAFLGEKSWLSENREAEILLPAVSELLKNFNKDFSDIRRILVINGPGSFTGLRIGIATVNTLTSFGAANAYAVDLFRAYWEKFIDEELNSDSTLPPLSALQSVAVLIFAGKNGVFFNQLPPPEILKLQQGTGAKSKLKNTDFSVFNVPLNELADYLKSRQIKTVIGEISDEQKANLGEAIFRPISLDFSSLAPLFLKELNEEETWSANKIISPVYLKAPNITVAKKM